MYYSNNEFIAASHPFILTSKGTLKYMIPSSKVQKLILTRKYHLHPRKINWLRCLVGGKFQGANNADFSDAVTLATIEKTPSQHFQNIEIKTSQKFKYLRFLFNSNELEIPYDGDGAGIAEIEFFDDHNSKLNGTAIGTPGKEYNIYHPDLAFDNNVLTFFEDARDSIKSKWVGLKLKKNNTVSRIKYSARNDLNNVQIGDTYELFYWDNKKFTSLGKQIAKDTTLIYNNAFRNSVYLLKNHSSGTEERIFTYSGNKQIWW